MSSEYHIHPVLLFDEVAKMDEIGAGGITDNEPCCKMNGLGAVLLHFGRRILDITARTSRTSGIPHQLNAFVAINAECAFAVAQGSETFSAGAGVVTMTDDDADLCGFVHGFLRTDWVKESPDFLSVQKTCLSMVPEIPTYR